MNSKTLAIAVIEKDESILMRKKPYGSKPYQETWYLFGVEIGEGQDSKEQLIDYLKQEVGVDVSIEKMLKSMSEVKEDHDGETKEFHYENFICKYISGTPILPTGAEKIEWVQIDKLNEYDLVPPSKILLNNYYNKL